MPKQEQKLEPSPMVLIMTHDEQGIPTIEHGVQLIPVTSVCEYLNDTGGTSYTLIQTSSDAITLVQKGDKIIRSIFRSDCTREAFEEWLQLFERRINGFQFIISSGHGADTTEIAYFGPPHKQFNRILGYINMEGELMAWAKNFVSPSNPSAFS